MNGLRLLSAVLAVWCAWQPIAGRGNDSPVTPKAVETVSETVVYVEAPDSLATGVVDASEPPSIFGQQGSAALGHFSWGIDLGTGIDMTANDMTYVSIQGYFGYKNSFLKFLGAGAGMEVMMNNPSRCYPVFGMLRTSFSRKPRLCFLDLRAGVSFNSMFDLPNQTGFYGSLGLGITLAKGRKFSSHIILAYTFMPMHDIYTDPVALPDPEMSETGTPAPAERVRNVLHDLHYASIRIGCAF